MHRERLCVLGLDGLPLSLARDLSRTEGGLSPLPNLARLAHSAHARTIRAEVPELSPVNWTSMFTGEGPEKHGVFGFTAMDREYGLRIVNFHDVRCPTVFERLGEAGKVSRVINLPNTYPAASIRGMQIAGFVADELPGAVYPPVLASMLSSAPELAPYGYLLEADTNRGAADLEYLLDQLRLTLKSRLHALSLLWADLDWDLFVHVFTETDRLFHFFYPAVARPAHPLHGPCMDFLRQWDAAIGVFLERFDALPGPKRLICMADHGFTELKTEVCLNRWLEDNGYLATRKADDEWDARAILPGSRALALDPGRIYIHDARFAGGHVREAEKPQLLREIRAGLTELCHEGQPVMREVLTGSEAYPGSTFAHTPDLVCIAKPGLDLKAKFGRQSVFGHFGRFGAHTLDGAFLYDSSGAQLEPGAQPEHEIQPGRESQQERMRDRRMRDRRMRDIGQEILKHFGLQ